MGRNHRILGSWGRSTLTCAHYLAELEQALEGEEGHMRRTPFICSGVEVLLVAQPASSFQPSVSLELIQLHIGLW